MRRSAKTSLFLIELLAALLLFAFCAAISVRLFAAANRRLKDAQDLTAAVQLANSAAELYKAKANDPAALTALLNGSRVSSTISVFYGSERDTVEVLAPNSRDTGFRLDLTIDEDGDAFIRVSRSPSGETLYELIAAAIPE
ncbi:MAG: hypothetical protein LBC65_05420 [Oscillospiraceae bacterium]|jgi:type II secretory pathway pseudopilin PulG|nr:hypothetical protein [Oscillospiraceae bacterium]